MSKLMCLRIGLVLGNLNNSLHLGQNMFTISEQNEDMFFAMNVFFSPIYLSVNLERKDISRWADY